MSPKTTDIDVKISAKKKSLNLTVPKGEISIYQSTIKSWYLATL